MNVLSKKPNHTPMENFPWKTKYNSVPEVGEVNNLPDQTVPNLTMSIPEILHRFSTGLNVHDVKVPIFEGDELMPDLKKMDLADREQYGQAYYDELQEIREKFRETGKRGKTNVPTSTTAQDQIQSPIATQSNNNEPLAKPV